MQNRPPIQTGQRNCSPASGQTDPSLPFITSGAGSLETVKCGCIHTLIISGVKTHVPVNLQGDGKALLPTLPKYQSISSAKKKRKQTEASLSCRGCGIGPAVVEKKTNTLSIQSIVFVFTLLTNRNKRLSHSSKI